MLRFVDGEIVGCKHSWQDEEAVCPICYDIAMNIITKQYSITEGFAGVEQKKVLQRDELIEKIAVAMFYWMAEPQDRVSKFETETLRTLKYRELAKIAVKMMEDNQ